MTTPAYVADGGDRAEAGGARSAFVLHGHQTCGGHQMRHRLDQSGLLGWPAMRRPSRTPMRDRYYCIVTENYAQGSMLIRGHELELQQHVKTE